MMFANVDASPPATEPEASTGTGRHPLTPGPTRDPTHPGSRACRYVPCSSLCPPSATTCLGGERERPPKQHEKGGQDAPTRDAARRHPGPRTRRAAGRRHERPAQPAQPDRPQGRGLGGHGIFSTSVRRAMPASGAGGSVCNGRASGGRCCGARVSRQRPRAQRCCSGSAPLCRSRRCLGRRSTSPRRGPVPRTTGPGRRPPGRCRGCSLPQD